MVSPSCALQCAQPSQSSGPARHWEGHKKVGRTYRVARRTRVAVLPGQSANNALIIDNNKLRLRQQVSLSSWPISESIHRVGLNLLALLAKGHKSIERRVMPPFALAASRRQHFPPLACQI